MFPTRPLALLFATMCLLAASPARGAIGIQPIANQDIPSGKTLVVPLVATDPGGPARTYSVSVGTPTTGGTTTKVAGVTAAIRTGDPHFMLGVRYYVPASSGTGDVLETGTMDFQFLREFSPVATTTIAGLTQGASTAPGRMDHPTKYITFHRVVPGFVIQGGDPLGTGLGGPGFTFPSEFSSALVFSGSAGQLAMANSNVSTTRTGGVAVPANGHTNGSQFFITLVSDRPDLDYGYTVFGQLLRGYGTLFGIATTPLENDGSGNISKPINPVDITSASVFQNNTDAVLLLSATGVCNAVVTVTATSGTDSAVQTFTASAVADTLSDPPFPAPVADLTAPNGNVNVTVAATDLQLDLVRYGYQTFLPVNDGFITSGTSPIVSVPLISNTDNTVGAEVDSWNGSPRGFAGEPFHVGAGAKPLRGSLTPIPAGINGALKLAPYAVALFSSSNSMDTAASFTASVNWGDGTYLSGTEVTVASAGRNEFKVVAGHDYTRVGEFPVQVEIADAGGAHLTLTGTANIAKASIAISGTDIAHTGGALANEVVAGFHDYGAAGGHYTATINWGDGSVSAGAIKSGSDSIFEVTGSHTYKTPGLFTVSSSVARTGSNGDSAATCVTARISGVTAPQVFPPFPQAHLAQIWTTIYTDSNSVISTGSSTGGNPFAALVRDGTNGSLYGTTEEGGVNGDGTVFQITSSGSLGTLYSFTGGTDGANPYAALVQAGTNGSLYGTAESGGANSDGTVYQISSSGSFTSIYSFTGGSDGSRPYAALIQDGTNGLLYGTCSSGGGSGDGTVFSITTSGTIATLHAFTSGSNDGANPIGLWWRAPTAIFMGRRPAEALPRQARYSACRPAARLPCFMRLQRDRTG